MAEERRRMQNGSITAQRHHEVYGLVLLSWIPR